MCHCLVLEIIQFLGTVETPCLQEPSDTSPLFELAKLTDTAEVVACCAAFLSSFREASSEDIKIIKGRKTSMISSWLAVWEAESRQTKLQRNLCNFICLHSASFGNFQRNVGGTVAVWHLQFLHWRSCNLHGIAFSESISHMSLLGPWNYPIPWNCWNSMPSGSFRYFATFDFATFRIGQTDWHRRSGGLLCCFLVIFPRGLLWGYQNYQRQEDINDFFLASHLGSRIETDEAAAEPLQLYLSPFCFLRQFPAQCWGHRGSVAPPVSPLAILQPPWHRLQWVNLPYVTAWSLKLSNSLELLKLHAFRILQILRHFWFRHFSNSPNWLTPQKWWPAVLLSCHLPSRPPLRISKLSKAGRHQWFLPG